MKNISYVKNIILSVAIGKKRYPGNIRVMNLKISPLISAISAIYH